MNKRIIGCVAAMLSVAGVLTGAFYSWTIAAGVFWFGASFLMFVVVMNSFNNDMSSRLPEP